MKSDITRTGKDEADRQSLNNEQLKSLPANPAGDLNEGEMNAVCGGGGYEGYESNYGVGAASSSSAFASEHRIHSYSVLCDINVFSADIHVLGLDRLINIGNCETRPCLNND